MNRLSRLLVPAFAVLLAACDSGTADVGDVTAIPPVPPVSSTSTIVDATGAPLSSVDSMDPVQLSVSGLPANQTFSIEVLAPDGTPVSPAGGYTIMSDEEGKIPTSTVVQNLDLVFAAKSGGIRPKTPPTGQFQIVVRAPNGNAVGRVNFQVGNDSRLYCAEADGEAEGSFSSDEHVFVKIEKAGGSLADGTYDLFVLSDLNPVLTNGDSLGGNRREVTVSGGVALVDIGTFNAGTFDVVLDLDRDGFFDNDDLVSRRPRLNPCFTIQQAQSVQPIVQQICADREGNYRDVFDPRVGNAENRDMFAYITPSRRGGAQHVLAVRKYVVAHQDSWSQGDPLNDVTAGYETDPVQGFCTNEAPWMVWPRQLFQPGCYDVIIDTNRNGVYDVGTDFLDNIDNRNQVTCGCRVPDVDCSGRITIASPADNSTTEETGTELSGTVVGSPVRGFVTIVAGGQTNRVDVAADSQGNFDSRVPLFRGENLITITFEYGDGTACSVSLRVTSNPVAAPTLFRVQLTWDQDVDSDLHLVRPHAGPGAGLFDRTVDCYYSNCTPGDEDEIDWGLPGDADDPTLDFDCTGGCPLIENIFINEINEDGAYTVFVDQYGDTATNTVTVFIGSVQVGQVICPTTTDGTNADVCRVGVIQWSGGTGGTGTFIADGTVGPESQFTATAKAQRAKR